MALRHPIQKEVYPSEAHKIRGSSAKMQNKGFKYKLYMYNYMEQLKTKIKRWGNSFGIVVPMDIIRKENLREDADVTVSIQTSHTITVGELMDLSIKLGVATKLKNVDTQKALREVDKAFWPEGD